MIYTLMTYHEGKQCGTHMSPGFEELATLGMKLLFEEESQNQFGVDEFEITDRNGLVLAYCYTPDSDKAKQLEFDYEIEKKAALEEDRRGHYD